MLTVNLLHTTQKQGSARKKYTVNNPKRENEKKTKYHQSYDLVNRIEVWYKSEPPPPQTRTHTQLPHTSSDTGPYSFGFNLSGVSGFFSNAKRSDRQIPAHKISHKQTNKPPFVLEEEVWGVTLLFSGPDKVAFITIRMGSDILEPFTKVIQTRICLVTHKYYKHTTHVHTYIHKHIWFVFCQRNLSCVIIS